MIDQKIPETVEILVRYNDANSRKKIRTTKETIIKTEYLIATQYMMIPADATAAWAGIRKSKENIVQVK